MTNIILIHFIKPILPVVFFFFSEFRIGVYLRKSKSFQNFQCKHTIKLFKYLIIGRCEWQNFVNLGKNGRYYNHYFNFYCLI